MSLQEVALI